MDPVWKPLNGRENYPSGKRIRMIDGREKRIAIGLFSINNFSKYRHKTENIIDWIPFAIIFVPRPRKSNPCRPPESTLHSAMSCEQQRYGKCLAVECDNRYVFFLRNLRDLHGVLPQKNNQRMAIPASVHFNMFVSWFASLHTQDANLNMSSNPRSILQDLPPPESASPHLGM